MILVDLSHTAHTRARTGVQRVCRSIHVGLQASRAVTAVTFDPFQRDWRALEPWEQANLASHQPERRRKARWPLLARWRGRWRRVHGGSTAIPPPATAVLVPEIFSAAVATALPRLAPSAPRVAVFHDAIALKLPELSPPGTVARFPGYLQELRLFDGIAAVSADSRDALLDYWRWLEIPRPPPVVALPLGTDPAPPLPASPPPAAHEPPHVLCVGSLEGRKNHLALLEAAETLWRQGHRFELELVGLAHPRTGAAALARLRALRAQGHSIRYHGAVDEATLETAYARCRFTVYPSLLEGFGLPVIESLRRGRPCICSRHGALGESIHGGGCLGLDDVTAPALAAAMSRLLRDPALHARLTAEASARTFRSWSDYAAELAGFIDSIVAGQRR